MAIPAQTVECQQPLRSTYVCSGVTVQGLPTRSVLKSESRYFVTISIDKVQVWKSREIRSKESTVVWNEGEDKHEFECAPAASLKATVCKNHSRGRPAEEVGTVTFSLSTWLQTLNVAQLVTRPITHVNPILIRLSVSQKDTTPPAPEITLQEPLPTTDADANATPPQPDVTADTPNTATGHVGDFTHGLGDIATMLEELREKLDLFTTSMDEMPDIHPYLKMSWTILSAMVIGSEVVEAQQQRVQSIKRLIAKMTTVYELLCDAQVLRDDKARMGVLSRLALQTVDCAHFISSCIGKTKFVTRLASPSASKIAIQIDEYNNIFDALLRDFQTGSLVRTEIATSIIVEDIKALGVAIDLENIPYTGGAGYEPSRRCLENTRKVLLEEIGNWASSTDTDTAGVLLLMGPAGTGKSTIAHTIAHRFREMNRLGASFCFSTSASATRRPVNLFRNIARELANFHPAFKASLQNAIRNDLNLCTTEDLQLQFNKYILEPAQALAINGTTLIMIDGLDESGTEKERRKLVRLLLTLLGGLPIGFRVLVTCRAEQDILKVVERPTSSVTIVRMPTTEQDRTLSTDVLTYIRYVLEDEGNTFSQGMDEGCCVALRDRAEGLFQWAFVACDYIISPKAGRTVVQRYNDVLSGTMGRTGLDGLYKTVLIQTLDNDVGALESFCAVMGFVLRTVEPLSMRSLRTLMELLPQKPRMAPDDILPFLGSLLSGVGEETAPVRPLHSSFWELLQSAERGGRYHIGGSGHHDRLLVASLRLLQNRLEFNMGGLESAYQLNRDIAPSSRLKSKVTEDVLYACKHWGYHLSKCGPGCEGTAEVRGLLHGLFMKKLLFWIDAASVGGVVRGIVDCLNIAMDRLPRISDDVAAMAHDCIKFIRAFGRAIVDSAPHTYLSALPLAPTRSSISRSFYSRNGRLARVAHGQATQWSVVKTVISGHSDGITSVAFSFDNRHIVSGSCDDTVRIWDAETGEAVGDPLTGHSNQVTSVAFSPDNRRVVSGSYDKTIRIWDAETGEAVGYPLRSHMNVVSSVAFSRDNQRIVSGSWDRTVRIWNAETGEAIGNPLTGHSDSVMSVVVSFDSRRIVSGSWDKTIRIWDAETGEAVGNPLMGHSHKVTSVAFSSDNRRIVSGSVDRTVRIWDAVTGEAVGDPLTGHSNQVTCVAFSSDNRRIVSGSNDTTVRIWDAETGQTVGNLVTDHSGRVKSVAFSSDDRRIVSGSDDKTVRIWDAETGEAVGDPLTGHSDSVMSVVVSFDSRRIVSGSWDNTVRIWDAETGEAVGNPLTDHTDGVTSVAFSSDSRRIVSGSRDKTVRIWDAEMGEAVGDPLTGHSSMVSSVAFSTDNRRIVSGSWDNTLRIWDAETGEAVGNPLTGHSDMVSSVAFWCDNRRIVSGSWDKTVRLWNAETGEAIGNPLTGHCNSVMSVVVSSDNRRIVSGSWDNTIRIWDAETGEAVGNPLTGHSHGVTSVAFSSDHRRIVSSSHDRTVRIWDAVTGEAVGDPLTGHSNQVTCVAFSPDNRRIVSGSYDKTIRIWDAKTAEAIGNPVTDHSGRVNSAAFSSDNRRIVSSPRGDTARVWDVDMAEALTGNAGVPTDRLSHNDDVRLASTEQNSAATFVHADSARFGPSISRRGELSLSPYVEHQMTQRCGSHEPGQPHITFDYETGWIMGNGRDHILWIPPDQLQRVYTPQCPIVIPGPMIHVDLSKFVHGTRWTECRLPLP